jgi:hypothetical protein
MEMQPGACAFHTVYLSVIGAYPLCYSDVVAFITVQKNLYCQQICENIIFELLGDMFRL